MKVEGKAQPRRPAQQRFDAHLPPKKPAAKPTPNVPSPARLAQQLEALKATRLQAQKTVATLREVRASHQARAALLTERRAEASEKRIEQQNERAMQLLLRELARPREPEARPTGSGPERAPKQDAGAQSEPKTSTAELARGHAAAGQGSATGTPVEGETRPSPLAAAEWIERVEVMLKAQRPALRLSVGGGLQAELQIERLGPREVSVRLELRKGQAGPQDLEAIRAEIEARGIRLAKLELA